MHRCRQEIQLTNRVETWLIWARVRTIAVGRTFGVRSGLGRCVVYKVTIPLAPTLEGVQQTDPVPHFMDTDLIVQVVRDIRPQPQNPGLYLSGVVSCVLAAWEYPIVEDFTTTISLDDNGFHKTNKPTNTIDVGLTLIVPRKGGKSSHGLLTLGWWIESSKSVRMSVIEMSRAHSIIYSRYREEVEVPSATCAQLLVHINPCLRTDIWRRVIAGINGAIDSGKFKRNASAREIVVESIYLLCNRLVSMV